jgi:hypothetical protein
MSLLTTGATSIPTARKEAHRTERGHTHLDLKQAGDVPRVIGRHVGLPRPKHVLVQAIQSTLVNEAHNLFLARLLGDRKRWVNQCDERRGETHHANLVPQKGTTSQHVKPTNHGTRPQCDATLPGCTHPGSQMIPRGCGQRRQGTKSPSRTTPRRNTHSHHPTNLMLSALNNSAMLRRRRTSHSDSSHFDGSGLDNIACVAQNRSDPRPSTPSNAGARTMNSGMRWRFSQTSLNAAFNASADRVA